MMRGTKKGYVWLLAAGGVLAASIAWSGNCLDGGCHTDEVDWKYLHGPLAAESLGAPGCVSCHVPAGALCTVSNSGRYNFMAAKAALCTTCHEKSTSTDHSERNTDCLDCHSPHGSDEDMNMLR